MKKSIVVFIMFILIASSFFYIGKNWKKDTSFSLAVQEYLKNREDFLQKNYQPLNIKDEFPDMGILYDDLKPNDIYLLGGDVQNASNIELEDYCLKYLTSIQGVKNVVLNIPYSVSISINKYLETGDENHIKSFSQYMLLSGIYKNQLSRNWISIKEYYDNLPKDNKFKVVGFNMNLNPYYTNYMIKSIIKDKNIDSLLALKELENLVKDIKGDKIVEEEIKRINQSSIKLKEEILKDEGYKKIFQGDYLDLIILVNELNESTKAILNKSTEEDIEINNVRFFEENYSRYFLENKGKYFASLNYDSLKSNPFKGLTYKMGVLYVKSNGDNPLIYNDLIPYIEDKDNPVAFRTKGKYSPFNYVNMNILSEKIVDTDSTKLSEGLNLLVILKSNKK